MSANLILQALPDLQKFMDSIHNRIMSCHKLSQAVENDAGDTPAGKECLSIECPIRISESLFFTGCIQLDHNIVVCLEGPKAYHWL